LSVIDPDPSVYLLLGAWRIRLGARANQSKHRQLMCHGAVLIDAAVFLLGESSRRLFARRFPAADEFQVGAVSSHEPNLGNRQPAVPAKADFELDPVAPLEGEARGLHDTEMAKAILRAVIGHDEEIATIFVNYFNYALHIRKLSLVIE
jgi:hypothetical protein